VSSVGLHLNLIAVLSFDATRLSALRVLRWDKPEIGILYQKPRVFAVETVVEVGPRTDYFVLEEPTSEHQGLCVYCDQP
jgi:hypothetical protein